jgi:O-antigen ligase
VLSRRISFGLALLGGVGSLAIFTSLFDPFAAAKSFVIFCGAALLAGYAALDLFKTRIKGSNSKQRLFLYLVLGFLALFLFRTMTTSDVNGALFGVIGRHSGFLAYFGYAIIFVLSMFYVKLSNFEVLVKGLLVAGFLASAYSLLEFFDLEFWNMTKVYEGTSGLFGNPNFSGAFMALTAIAATWFLFTTTTNQIKLIAVITLPLALFGIYTAKALQGYISLAIGISLIVFMTLWKVKKSYGYVSLGTIAFGGIAAVLGSLQVGPLSSLLYKGSVSERGDMWRTATSMIKDNPLWGVGIERYGFYFRQYRDLKQALRAGPDVFSDNAHNVVLHLMATGGILLGALYLLISVGILAVGIKALLTSHGVKQKALTAVLALWIPIQAQNAISVDNPGVFVWSWILGGAVIGIASDAIAIEEKKPKVKVTKVSSPASDVHPLAPLVALVCVLLAIGFTVKPLISQKSFAFAFYLGTDPSNPETLKNKVDVLIKAENQDPGNVTWPRYSANSLFIDKAWKETIEAAERAISKDPEDWISWWFMASAYEQSGERVKAIPSRLKTVELDPWNTSVLLELAKNQLAAGDSVGFEESKKKILRINPNGSDAQAVSGL